MPLRPVPIPISIWQRLAALDAPCDWSIERHDANRPSKMLQSHLNYERIWEIRVCLRNRPDTEFHVLGGKDLCGVLEMAVQTAEGRGWHRAWDGMSLEAPIASTI